ncbi:Gfo/Idh/MocA family oxidoreductase [Actinomyces timonensis]|uniref:Inositol 2-dehydrogenase n=1 Tax=Actinomyces timonensis TaxID=1288391 RepID=A0AAU8N561_9ACTO
MTVRIGLIGAGGMGRAHLARIHDDLSGGEIVAVADINLDAAKSAAEPYGAKAYATSDELINDPGVDAVLIATFGKVHAPDVIKAIEAGKHVLCEKPLATTAEDCVAIMEAEQRAGKRLVTVGFMRRFDAAYNEMKAVLDSGEHGQALMVHNRHRNPSVPENYTSRMAIDDTAIHEFDTMRWLLGEEIVKVRVDRPKPTTHRFDHLIDPIVVVAYTESGVRIDDEVNVNLQWAYSIECELVLETAAVRLGDQEKIRIRDSHGNRNAMCQSHIDRFQAAFNREVQEWINAVAEDRHTGSTAWDGYAATCVVDAAVKSHEDGGSPLVDVELIDKPAFYA